MVSRKECVRGCELPDAFLAAPRVISIRRSNSRVQVAVATIPETVNGSRRVVQPIVQPSAVLAPARASTGASRVAQTSAEGVCPHPS